MPKKKGNGRHQQIAKLDEGNATKLSSNIKCDASVTDLLTPATIELANYVVKHLKEEDPGVFVQIIDQNALHQALALNHSPVAQGVDADASAEAFRAWLINGARNVRPNSQVPRNSDFALAFHQLTQVSRPFVLHMDSGTTGAGIFNLKTIDSEEIRLDSLRSCFGWLAQELNEPLFLPSKTCLADAV